MATERGAHCSTTTAAHESYHVNAAIQLINIPLTWIDSANHLAIRNMAKATSYDAGMPDVDHIKTFMYNNRNKVKGDAHHFVVYTIDDHHEENESIQ